MAKNKPELAITQNNLKAAEQLWPGRLEQIHVNQLKVLEEKYCFSVPNGDLILIDNRWHVTHTGLLRLATRKRCSGIHVRPVAEFCDVRTVAGHSKLPFTNREPARDSPGLAMPI